MECKEYSGRKFVFFIIVLIETLWNVKIDVRTPVNQCFHRINRNIVECKVARPCFFCIIASKVLIETLWNVKLA